MGKRKHSEEEIRKKIRKLEKKLRKKQDDTKSEEERTPLGSPVDDRSLAENPIMEIDLINSDENIPEELLGALGPEGQEITNKGEPIQQQLCSQWTKIMIEGLGKESRETILKKYPTPENFPAAVAPEINPEISASLTEITLKRDRRITSRQNHIGKLMSSLGKTLTQILKGEINNKKMVEEINDAAKIAADIFHQDTVSMKFFALSNTTSAVKEAIKDKKPDKFLFGIDCGESIRTAQTVQRTGSQIKLVRRTEGNWRSPLQPRQQVRSGPYQQTQNPRTSNLTPQRRQQQPAHRGYQQQFQKPRSYNPPPRRRVQKPAPRPRHQH